MTKVRLVSLRQEVLPYIHTIVWPIATISNMAGVWTVTIVTLHRYIAACWPHHVPKFASLRVARYQASLARTRVNSQYQNDAHNTNTNKN